MHTSTGLIVAVALALGGPAAAADNEPPDPATIQALTLKDADTLLKAFTGQASTCAG